MCVIAFIGCAACRFSIRLASAAASAEASAAVPPETSARERNFTALCAPDALDDLPGAAAIRARLAVGELAAAVAVGTDVFTGSQGARRGLVARVERRALRPRGLAWLGLHECAFS